MSDDPTPHSSSPSSSDPTAEDNEVLLDAYDLNDDGTISAVEDGRATLGIVDARLEQIAEHGGIVGKVADAAHHVVDRLDND